MSTKHESLADMLRQQIASGSLLPGDRLPPFSAFRTQYSVTTSTIDKVFSTLESEGVIERCHGKGVFVAQKRARTKYLGFVGFDIAQEHSMWGFYWARLLEGVQSSANAAGYHVLLINPEIASSWHEEVDGAIFHGIGSERAEQFRVANCVSVMYPLPNKSSVIVDEFGGGQQAIEHLLEQGHRSIAFLLDDIHWQTQMRLKAYHATLKEAGITADPEWVRIYKDDNTGQQFRNQGREQMFQWLANGWHELGCTALFCQNDEVATGVMEALQASGIRVPEDVSVIGYDGTSLGEMSQPKLTSIEVPLREIGQQATKLLVEQIENKSNEPQLISLPTHLKLRGSTSRLAHTLSYGE